MQASITVKIANKSTLHTLNVKRKRAKYTFFDSLVFKVSKVYQQTKVFNLSALSLLQDIKEKIEEKTSYLFDEIDRYEAILEKSNACQNATFKFKASHEKEIDMHNPIACDLIELITTYDLLISKLKLLAMHGCFQTMHDFMHLEKKYKKEIDEFILSLQQFKFEDIKDIDINNFKDKSADEITKHINIKMLKASFSSNLLRPMSDSAYKDVLKRINQIEEITA